MIRSVHKSFVAFLISSAIISAVSFVGIEKLVIRDGSMRLIYSPPLLIVA